MNVADWWADTDRRRPKYLDKNPFQSLCPPQIPHGLVWDWSCVFAARGRRLTAWNNSRPSLFVVTLLAENHKAYLNAFPIKTK